MRGGEGEAQGAWSEQERVVSLQGMRRGERKGSSAVPTGAGVTTPEAEEQQMGMLSAVDIVHCNNRRASC